VIAELRLARSRTSVFRAKSSLEHSETLAVSRARTRKVIEISREIYERAEIGAKREEGNVAQLRAMLVMSEANLRNTDIASPVDGTVVARDVVVDQRIVAGAETPLFIIAGDLSLIKLEANIDDANIGAIRLGNRASFTVLRFPNHPFAGEVTESRSSQHGKEAGGTSTVVITAPNPELLLQSGMLAAISLTASGRDEASQTLDPSSKNSQSRETAQGTYP